MIDSIDRLQIMRFDLIVVVTAIANDLIIVQASVQGAGMQMMVGARRLMMMMMMMIVLLGIAKI